MRFPFRDVERPRSFQNGVEEELSHQNWRAPRVSARDAGAAFNLGLAESLRFSNRGQPLSALCSDSIRRLRACTACGRLLPFRSRGNSPSPALVLEVSRKRRKRTTGRKPRRRCPEVSILRPGIYLLRLAMATAKNSSKARFGSLI